MPRRDSLSVALETVVGRLARMVRAVGRRHGLADADVDELEQEVRIRLWRARAGSENLATAPTSYVYRTAMTAALDVVRRRRARREESLDDEPGEGASPASAAAAAAAPDDPAAALERSELEERIWAAVEDIPATRRAPVRMYLAGYGREEIAETMGWSEAKTRNLLYRGLADLRERLTALGIGPEVTR